MSLNCFAGFFRRTPTNTERRLLEVLFNCNGAHDRSTCTRVTTLLDRGVRVNLHLINSLGDGVTPLHVAAINGCAICIQSLVDRGALIDCVDVVNCTPLFYAAKCRREDAVRCLLKNAADVTIVDKNGFMPLHLACKRHCTKLVELLLLAHPETVNARESGRQLTPLHIAATSGDIACVELLLMYNADIDALSTEGVKPIHMAALSGNTAVVRCLLDNGADDLALTNEGRLPLHNACTFGHTRVVELLLDRSPSSVNTAATNDRATPLHEAATCGSVSCVRLLLDRGANTDALQREGFRAFDLAIVYSLLPPPVDRRNVADHDWKTVIKLLKPKRKPSGVIERL